MLGKLTKALRDRRIARLARKTLLTAAEMYRSGEFGWIEGEELQKINGGVQTLENPRAAGYVLSDGTVASYDDPEHYPVEHLDIANAGCALGGLSKAAWIVLGKPQLGTARWRDKLAVEHTAQGALAKTINPLLDSGDYALSTITRYNDRSHDGGERVIAALEGAAAQL